MPIRGIGGPRDPSRPQPTAPRSPSPGGINGSCTNTVGNGLGSRGVPRGAAPQQRTALPTSRMPSSAYRAPAPETAGAAASRPSMVTRLAQAVGRELAAFVPDRKLSALGFAPHVLRRPPLTETLRTATTLGKDLENLRTNLENLRTKMAVTPTNPQSPGRRAEVEVASKQFAAEATDQFSKARQTWRAMRQTPVGELLANREAVKQQAPKLRDQVENTYSAVASMYPPTHPAWKDAAKALLMTELSFCHVHARMAAVNVLGLHRLVGAPPQAPRAPTHGGWV